MIAFLYVFKFLLNIVYLPFKLLPVKKDLIVFMSRQSNKVSLDFKLLGDKLEKNYKVVYLCKTLDGKEKSNLIDRVKYGLYMFKQMFYLARTRVCIIDTYIPTISILKHKKSLNVIQMWHSIGTLKKCGYEILDTEEGNKSSIAKAMNMHKNYDYVLVASKSYEKDLINGFNCSKDCIKILTLPRVDLLMDKKYEKDIKNKIFNKYPKLKEKENIVYCPTFRKNENEFKDKLNELINAFDFSKYNLIVKLHPLSKITIDNNNVIFDKSFSTFDMLFIANKVISDYSCVIYEAGVRNIPLYFYNFDFSNYENNRGLTIDYNNLPGYKCNNAKELVKSLEKKYDMDYLIMYINKYVSNTTKCTEKICDFINELMKR